MATTTPHENGRVPNAREQFEYAVDTQGVPNPHGIPDENPFMTSHSEVLRRLWDLSQRFAPSDR